MGKNQQYKSMQRSKASAEDQAAEPGAEETGIDVSFHTPEWHAARVAALTAERMSWEDWKKVQKATAAKAAAAEEEEEERMREYRKQLDSDREARLSKGINNAHLRVKVKESKRKERQKESKSKDKKRKSKHEKKRKHKKERKHSSSESGPGSGSDKEGSGAGGPVPLSEFFGNK